jgi:hypothetical protein
MVPVAGNDILTEFTSRNFLVESRLCQRTESQSKTNRNVPFLEEQYLGQRKIY